MPTSSSVAEVSEKPSCLAASSQSDFDVTLWQLDPLVTLVYPLPAKCMKIGMISISNKKLTTTCCKVEVTIHDMREKSK